MTDREKLIEILRVPIFPHELVDPIEAVADYLLDNGVVVREKGEWIDWAKHHGVVFFHHGIRSVGVVCSLCNKLSDNKFDFCPNCGADMRRRENG